MFLRYRQTNADIRCPPELWKASQRFSRSPFSYCLCRGCAGEIEKMQVRLADSSEWSLQAGTPALRLMSSTISLQSVILPGPAMSAFWSHCAQCVHVTSFELSTVSLYWTFNR